MSTKIYSKESRQTKQHVHTCMFCGQSGTEIGNEQHSTLVEQRERALEALKGVAIMLNTELEKYDNEPWAQRVRAAITTSEQEGTADGHAE